MSCATGRLGHERTYQPPNHGLVSFPRPSKRAEAAESRTLRWRADTPSR
jgi:hypothetical protein